MRLEESGQRLEALKERIRNINEAFHEIEEKEERVKIIDVNEISSVIDEITRLGLEKNIDFVSIEASREPSKPKRAKKHERPTMPIEIELKSAFKDLGHFLGALRQLKQASVYISAFNIEQDMAIAPLVKAHITAEVLIDNAFIK
jgi:Tfp pilus assembly protein PilO